MSANVVEVTNAILANRPGRTLIKVFPGQLHPRALERLLTELRPRLLILRRDLVFTYASQLRAQSSQSWGGGTDSTDVPYTFVERSALEYIVQADLWFDGVAKWAEALGLNNVWLTYSGLFATGKDVPLLESFYPGSALEIDERGGLRSSRQIQDRRSDPSTLEMMRRVSNLSFTTRDRLLRLPGSHH
jgi:hypothetical protein